MFVSALLIVKNEAADLPRWLRDMSKVADEMVVVDTGSTDNSRTLAVQGDARVVDYPWQDDFAAARNFALQQVRGDIVIFLDADEYYSTDMLRKLRLLIGRYFKGNPQVAGILAARIDVDRDNGDKFIDSSLQCRIFRRQLAYQGKIHETLVIPPDMKLVVAKDLHFYHTGYSAKRIKGKLARNLAYLQKKQADPLYEEQPLDYRYLMDCYYGLGDMEKAWQMSEICIKRFSNRLQGVLFDIYRCRVKAAIFAHRQPAEVMAVLQEAREKSGNGPYFTLLTGQYLYMLGNQEKSLAYIRAAVAQPAIDDLANPIQELLPAARRILAGAEND